jgi:bifunctional DNA-binding transcriptional regulator/antitoxin component of YhaV-PrlF toxin-antitoxin module
MKGYAIIIKEKGRTLLPVALQRAGNIGPGDTLIAQVNDDGDIVLVNRRRVLEKLWASMEVSDDSCAVADLKHIRVEGDAARLERVVNFEIHDEKDLISRTADLLNRPRQ